MHHLSLIWQKKIPMLVCSVYSIIPCDGCTDIHTCGSCYYGVHHHHTTPMWCIFWCILLTNQPCYAFKSTFQPFHKYITQHTHTHTTVEGNSCWNICTWWDYDWKREEKGFIVQLSTLNHFTQIAKEIHPTALDWKFVRVANSIKSGKSVCVLLFLFFFSLTTNSILRQSGLTLH